MNRISLAIFALLTLSAAPAFADDEHPCSHSSGGVTANMKIGGMDIDKARCRLAVDRGAIGQQAESLIDAQVELTLAQSDLAAEKALVDELNKKIADDAAAAKKTIDELNKKIADATATAKP